MITVEKLQRMLELQNKMNFVINPKWRKAGNNWLRAAWIECAELMDHLTYKWWKKQTPNIPQAHIELVDIWHFLLSQAIENEVSVENLLDAFTEDGKESLEYNSGNLDNLEWVELLVLSLLEEGEYIDYYICFSIVCDKVGLSFDELYRLYVGKNVLNIFRQDHGYKEDTYIKEWKSHIEPNGLIEDNIYLEMFMEEALKDKPEDIYEYLYNKLEVEYANNL